MSNPSPFIDLNSITDMNDSPPPGRPGFAPLAPIVLLAVVIRLCATPADAQVAPPSKAAGDDVVQLSPFLVNTERDTGFVASSALAGGRLATDLKDTPVAYSVMTRDLIDALQITDLTEAADWMPNSYRFPDGAGGGDTFNITVPVATRGVLGNNPLRQRNFFIYYSEMDSFDIERFDFGRGPNQILYGNGTVGGMQISTTKRARFDKPFENLDFSYGSWHNRRLVVDVNRPVGEKVAVRAAAVASDRGGWRDHETERRKAAFGTVSFKPARHTEVRLDGEVGYLQRHTPYAQLNDRFGGWDGATTLGYIPGSAMPKNNGALGINRNPGDYYVYDPVSGPDAIMQYTDWAITRGAGDTSTTPAGSYLQVGQINWNQSGASILHSEDVVPSRFDTALAHSKFRMPSETFTNGPDLPSIESHFSDVQLTLNQQIGDSLFFEVAGDLNRVHNRINRIEGAGATQTYIDINPTLPNGETNPNFLRPYGDGQFWYLDKNTDARSVRAAVAYVKDLGKWGDYSFNIMGGMTHQTVGTFNYSLAPGISTGQLADPRQWGNLGKAVHQRFYWGDPHPYRIPTAGVTFVTNTGATSTTTPVWVPRITDDSSNNVQAMDIDYNYILAATNAKFFNDRLVILGAMRYDDSKQHVKYLVRAGDFPVNWDLHTLYWRPDAPADWASLMYTPVGSANAIPAVTRPRKNNGNGINVADPAYANVRFADDYNSPDIIAKKWTPSVGSVLHVTKWLSLSGNYAKAISFNTAGAPDVYGRLLPAVDGKGWDLSARLSLLKDRLSLVATEYSDTEFGNYIDPTAVTNQINTLYEANVLGDTTIGGRNERNAADINGLVRDTRTRTASGFEAELVFNLTSSWRLMANVGLPKVTEKEYGPYTRAYVAQNADLFKQILGDAGGTVGTDGVAVLKPGVADTGNTGSESTGNEATRAVNAYNNIYTNIRNFVVGSRPVTSAANSCNVFTDYTFRAGWFKGVRVGAGFNWRGSRVVGYRGGDSIVDPSNPTRSIDNPNVDGYTTINAPGSTIWKATLGYTVRLKGGRQLSFNLSIDNLFDDRDITWTDTTTTLRPLSGDFTSPARETVLNPFQYNNPRRFYLTTSLKL